MSMENAILEHAAALREIAAALRERTAPINAVMAQISDAVEEIKDSATGKTLIEDKAAELATATQTRAATAREAKVKDARQNAAGKEDTSAIKLDDDLAAAVIEVEKANTPADAADLSGLSGLSGPLDYAKDVRPVLLAAIKRAGKDKVQALINTFGVDKADKVDPAKFGELLAGAQALAA